VQLHQPDLDRLMMSTDSQRARYMCACCTVSLEVHTIYAY
jgi:hypothetical protein